MQTEEQKRGKRKKVLKIAGAVVVLFLLVSCCGIGGLAFLGSEPTATPAPAVMTTVESPLPTVAPTEAPKLTKTPWSSPIATPIPPTVPPVVQPTQPPPTQPPQSTAVPTEPPPPAAVCDCSANIYNCSDFATHAQGPGMSRLLRITRTRRRSWS